MKRAAVAALLVVLPLAANADESRLSQHRATFESITSHALSGLVQAKNDKDHSFRAMWRRMGKLLPGNPFAHAPGRCRA